MTKEEFREAILRDQERRKKEKAEKKKAEREKKKQIAFDVSGYYTEKRTKILRAKQQSERSKRK